MATAREHEMRAFFAAAERSLLDLEEFADLHEISIRAVRWWQREFRERGEMFASDFVEVELQPAVSMGIELRIIGDECRIVIAPGFDAEHLSRVIDALRSC